MIPCASYRLQLHAGFGFAEAERLLPYLTALGISHVYASPILKAKPGSTHGYDVIDPSSWNPELGDDAAFRRWTDAIQAHGLKLMLDIVPNHLGVQEADNPWWLDVLENGPASRHARAFDIEWRPPQHELIGKLLLPVLGGPYGEVLEAGQIVPRFDAECGRFMLHYHGHRFPIDPADYGGLLRLQPLPEAADHPQREWLRRLCEGFDHLPARDTPRETERTTRQTEVIRLQAQLVQLHDRLPAAPAWLAACAQTLGGQAGDPRSFDALDAVLHRQAYRLAHWRAAGDELNYRRFFDINGLAGVRVEDPAVFEAMHQRIFSAIAEGRIAALRVDHPDGLTDPQRYFEQLQDRCGQLLPDAGDQALPCYIVAEKILAHDEAWPRDWPVHGDTGYRFGAQLNALLVDEHQEQAFDAVYTDFLGGKPEFTAELAAAKRSIMEISLAAELRQLTELAHDVALADRFTHDLTRDGLKFAITEMAAAFDVYRSYASAQGVPPACVARIEGAAAMARSRCRPSQLAYVDFIRQLLLKPMDEPATRIDSVNGDAAAKRLRFVQRFQQFSAPVMAKAMEDTVFYRYPRLLSLNEVGGDPRLFGCDSTAFHAANLARQREMPQSLLATSTHDSKRSEDVRARLAVLSEMPAAWGETLACLRGLAQTQWRIAQLHVLPSPSDELLLYQTLVGLLPAGAIDEDMLAGLRERIAAYMLKAVREAKQVSSWLDNDAAYEEAVAQCVAVLLARVQPNPFLSELRRFVDLLAPFGVCNSLAQVLLKMTSPGVPDIYQGAEDWFFALVDPDNRRLPDWPQLAQRLESARQINPQDLRQGTLAGGLHKVFVTQRLLAWRRDADRWMVDASYHPIDASGAQSRHAVAFRRQAANGAEQAQCIALAPRLPWGLVAAYEAGQAERLFDGRCWGDSLLQLPPCAARHWRNILDGRLHEAATSAGQPVLGLASVLRDLPVALLVPAGQPQG